MRNIILILFILCSSSIFACCPKSHRWFYEDSYGKIIGCKDQLNLSWEYFDARQRKYRYKFKAEDNVHFKSRTELYSVLAQLASRKAILLDEHIKRLYTSRIIERRSISYKFKNTKYDERLVYNIIEYLENKFNSRISGDYFEENHSFEDIISEVYKTDKIGGISPQFNYRILDESVFDFLKSIEGEQLVDIYVNKNREHIVVYSLKIYDFFAETMNELDLWGSLESCNSQTCGGFLGKKPMHDSLRTLHLHNKRSIALDIKNNPSKYKKVKLNTSEVRRLPFTDIFDNNIVTIKNVKYNYNYNGKDFFVY